MTEATVTKGKYEKKNEAYWNNDGNMKEFISITESNNTYFETFRNTRYPEWRTDAKQKDSWLQYKSRVGNFLDTLDKDIFKISAEDLQAYITGKANAKNHINGFLLFNLKNNTLNCRAHISKELLFAVMGI